MGRQRASPVAQSLHRLHQELGLERTETQHLTLVVLSTPPFTVVTGLPADRALQMMQLAQQIVIDQANVVGACDATIEITLAVSKTLKTPANHNNNNREVRIGESIVDDAMAPGGLPTKCYSCRLPVGRRV